MEQQGRRIRVVVQARTSSSRLPAKVLLPVGGVPIAVLVARRFLRYGLETVVATSVDPSDDVLAAELTRSGISFVRGSLNEVLARYRDATADMAQDDVCVRVTADNVFPDGAFLGVLLDEFMREGCDYLNNSQTLPYGLGAEIFTVGALRGAAAAATSEYDLEHVTPWIKRHCACRTSANDFGFGNIRSLRCTVDTFADYLVATSLFLPFPDPVAAGFEDLTAALVARQKAQSQPEPEAVGERPSLVLGTAQLGMRYGRSNQTGRPSPEAAVEIIRSAAAKGICQFDTARVYGDSERLLGLAIKQAPGLAMAPITKLAPFPADASGTTPTALVAVAESSVYRSLFELQVRRLPVLLVHRASQIDDHDGLVWERLKRFRDEGLVGKLGASVQTPQELEAVLRHPEIEHVQLPFNLLDRRWDDFFSDTRPSNVTFHVRSAFLQGLLTTADTILWPPVEGIDAEGIVREIGNFVTVFARAGRTDLCLAFVRAAPWVDGVVIGMETAAQLEENLRLFKNSPLSAAQFDEIRAAFPSTPRDLLDPSRWG